MAVQHLKTAEFDEVVEAAPLAMVDFWADWCGPCKMLTPTVEALAEQYGDRVVTGKVNVDEEPELARRFGIMSIPTVVFLKNGKEIEREGGGLAAGDLCRGAGTISVIAGGRGDCPPAFFRLSPSF